MIKLSNGHSFEYMVASGALGFDGQGWPWEWLLVKAGIIKPELFTTAIKTLTRNERMGNLRWTHPWSCVRLLKGGGSVNKVGLTNPGVEDWCNCIGPYLEYEKFPLVGSIYGTVAELKEMAERLDCFGFKALEINYSCPNTGHKLEVASEIVDAVGEVKMVSRFPLIVKVSADQEYVSIASQLCGVAEAVSLNSVPWSTVFGDKRSPLWKLEKKVGGGGGGVSGRPAQKYNWKAVRGLVALGHLPVIAPSIMSHGDLREMREVGAKAFSFGAIHLRTPWKPTQIVLQDKREHAA